MNLNKTDEVLAVVVKKALVVAEKTGNFVIEQTPLLLQEFYNWHIFSNILGILLGVLLLFLGYKIPFLWTHEEKGVYDFEKYFNRYAEETFMAWLVFGWGAVLGFIFIISCTYELVFILVAPRLYLIEYFFSLNK